MRCMDESSDGMLLSSGHGAIWHIQSSAMDATQSNFENNFITSSARMEDGTILFCSYNGKIYSSSSDGNSLTEKMDGNRIFGN